MAKKVTGKIRGKVSKKSAKPAGSKPRPRRAGSSIEPKQSLPFDLPKVSAAERARTARLYEALLEHYPDAHCELSYTAPHELLIATILSAQTTDAAVNRATPALFAQFPTPQHFASASPAEIEPFIRTLGFFRTKAKSLHGAMTILMEKHGGQVPQTMDELLELPGVARKTANVVLGNAYNINCGVVVDTHVQRVGRRMGLFKEGTSVTMIERRLMALLPAERWCMISHLLIWHGRRACRARGARCSQHPVCAEFGIACETRDI